MQCLLCLPFRLRWHPRAVALLLLCIGCGLLHGQAVSSVVFRDAVGQLRYQADEGNNYVPDFSHAGYKNGEAELPEVPTVMTIGPVVGDNTTHIQAALDAVAARTPDANGYRGALLLEAGVYDVAGQLFIRESGMVLRGSGQGNDAGTSTIIRGVGNTPELRNLIVIAKSTAPNWRGVIPGSRSLITSPFVPAGSRTLEVAAAELYREGDNVIVYHPSTEDWLRSIDFGATASDAPWRVGDLDMFYNRYVTDVNIPENKITLDVPIFDHLDRELAQAEVYTISNVNLLTESGVENLRIDVVTEGELVENHVRTTIFLRGVEDCWLKDVTALNFSYALVDMQVANRVTVKDCSGLSPHSPVTGGRRYNFNVSLQSNNVLFAGCRGSSGRHTFVSNGASSAAGIVWTDCTSDDDRSSSEGHRRWSQGLLFDNITFTNSETVNLLNLYNRGDFGTGHGWSSVHSVAWNVRTPPNRGMVIQRPPGRQNYAIGCFSGVTGNFRFAHPAGKIELTNQELAIPSLYAAQLEQRLATGPLPDAPARLTGTIDQATGDVSLNWLDIAANETGYEIRRTITLNGEVDIAIDTVAANTTSYTDTRGCTVPLGGSASCTYQVIALAANGPSPYSNPVTVEGTSSVREANAAELRVVPNPVTNLLRLETELPVRSIEVFDAGGRRVTDPMATKQLNTASWPPGFYYLKVTTQGGDTLSVRVVKR